MSTGVTVEHTGADVHEVQLRAALNSASCSANSDGSPAPRLLPPDSAVPSGPSLSPLPCTSSTPGLRDLPGPPPPPSIAHGSVPDEPKCHSLVCDLVPWTAWGVMRGAVAQDLCCPLCGGLGDRGLFIPKSLWLGGGGDHRGPDFTVRDARGPVPPPFLSDTGRSAAVPWSHEPLKSGGKDGLEDTWGRLACASRRPAETFGDETVMSSLFHFWVIRVITCQV